MGTPTPNTAGRRRTSCCTLNSSMLLVLLFADTEAVTRYLALEARTLECQCSLSGSPGYHKFGKLAH